MRFFKASVCAVFLLACACSTGPLAPETEEQSQLSENFALPSRVAVLPFVNQTSNPEAASQVRRVFYNYFSSLNYRDTELFVVDQAFEKEGWPVDVKPGEDIPWRKICQKLNVDGLVTGVAREYGKIYAVLYSQTAVSMAVQFRSCRNGSYIWQKEATETKREGDIPLSPTGLAASIVSTYLRHQDITALEVAAKLSMQLTFSMPNPSTLLAVPPEIRFFLHNASGRLLRPGEALRVVLRGAPGAKGYWSIPGVAERLPLREKEPGIYIGRYLVGALDRALDVQLTGYLVSPEKAESRWIDILGTVSLGRPTVLPAVIDGNMSLTPQKGPYLISELVLVKKNARLEILPGTVIWAESEGLVVNGQILALGDPDNKIRFRSDAETSWKGITVASSSQQSRFAHVEISNAEIGLNAFKSAVSASNLLLEENDWGLVAQESDVQLTSSRVRASRNVGVSSRNGKIELSGNVISGNKIGGAQFEAATVVTNNNAFLANGSWDAKNLDTDATLNLSNNWWGTTDIAAARTQGNITVQPVLERSPVTSSQR